MNPLVRPDPGLFIWTILTFLVLLTLLTRYAWRPLLTALHNRQERIRQSLEEARAAGDERERLKREAAEIMRQARLEADALITSSRADGERVREHPDRDVVEAGAPSRGLAHEGALEGGGGTDEHALACSAISQSDSTIAFE